MLKLCWQWVVCIVGETWICITILGKKTVSDIMITANIPTWGLNPGHWWKASALLTELHGPPFCLYAWAHDVSNWQVIITITKHVKSVMHNGQTVTRHTTLYQARYGRGGGLVAKTFVITLSILIQVPKSANFKCPCLSNNMLSGFTSLKQKLPWLKLAYKEKQTSKHMHWYTALFFLSPLVHI